MIAIRAGMFDEAIHEEKGAMTPPQLLNYTLHDIFSDETPVGKVRLMHGEVVVVALCQAWHCGELEVFLLRQQARVEPSFHRPITLPSRCRNGCRLL